MRSLLAVLAIAVAAATGIVACSDNADDLGVGAECTAAGDCQSSDSFTQECLTEFKGGYCGLTDCATDDDCPPLSACIDHGGGTTYCFRTCVDKVDCNANRTVDNESNCSSNVTFTDGAQGRKACVPPSSGI